MLLVDTVQLHLWVVTKLQEPNIDENTGMNFAVALSGLTKCLDRNPNQNTKWWSFKGTMLTPPAKNLFQGAVELFWKPMAV